MFIIIPVAAAGAVAFTALVWWTKTKPKKVVAKATVSTPKSK